MGAPARVELEPAYVLHARGYRETSQLLEVFTASHGRVGIVARGARRPKSTFRGLLDPFQPLRLSWSGRGELATLTHAEPAGVAPPLASAAVMAAFYVNELLLRLLERRDPHPDLFVHYGGLIEDLRQSGAIEPALRTFEMHFLKEIGYGLNFSVDARTRQPVVPEQWYELQVEEGLVAAGADPADEVIVYPGHAVLAIERMDFSDPATLRAAKHMLRAILNFHLGDRGLRTRAVAAAMKKPA